MLVVSDIDGVLAQNHERVDLIVGDNKDWPTFFLRCMEDTATPLVRLLRDLDMEYGLETILLTSRPEKYEEMTRRWLKSYGVDFSELICMPDKDSYISIADNINNATIWKVEQLKGVEDRFGKIDFVFEDEPDTIWAMREAGYPVIPIYSGYYECPVRRVDR